MNVDSFAYAVLTYLLNNALNIIGTILLGLIGAYLTQRYIKREVTSARKERLDQAKTNLLDVLEMQVINDKDISEEKIENLMAAVDRKYSVSLSANLSKKDILQDVELRIEESRHLSPSDKEEYSNRIEQQISSIKESNKPTLPAPQSNTFSRLEQAIKESETQEAIELLNDLKPVLQGMGPAATFSATGGIIRFLFSDEGIRSYPPERRRRILIAAILFSIVYILAGVYIIGLGQ